jgi:hypothetical protein
VVFFENAVPGDVIDVQLYKNKKDWAEGFRNAINILFNIQQIGSSLFAGILVFVAVASGKIYLMKNS